MQVESLFNESIKKIEYDKTTAIALFEKINFFLNKKMLDAMLDEELRVFALSNMHLFLITGIEDGKYADKALEAFELIKGKRRL
ncbi:MAG: hypothetical protein Q8876_09865 [Bacillota bacterium]|nr:hypothetical protein [Bacillota bacterium]